MDVQELEIQFNACAARRDEQITNLKDNVSTITGAVTTLTNELAETNRKLAGLSGKLIGMGAIAGVASPVIAAVVSFLLMGKVSP